LNEEAMNRRLVVHKRSNHDIPQHMLWSHPTELRVSCS
jgi:hypothetical protein